MKRLFDISFSLCVLVIGFPIFFLIAVLVKISSQGPVFYAGKRIGLQGKTFLCWKFRTMCENAETVLQEALANDLSLRSEWFGKYKLQEDFRVTKFGSFLRKSSLDELPQFWNVLKGDLSVVGPRPVTYEESQLFRAKTGEKVFSIRPGITGLWQVSGRNALSYEERIHLETKYVETRSFKLDLLIIVKTLPTMLFSKGAS